MKIILLRLQAQVLENPEVDFCTHYLMSYRGTLVYVTQSYDPLNPYLRGFHITKYSSRPDRDEDVWKLSTARLKPVKVTEE